MHASNPTPEPDPLAALCFAGATVYLRHDNGILACKRCGKPLPPFDSPMKKLERKE